jgi:RAD50-interacting protein 1
MRQSFTTFGATQFSRDGSALFALVDRYIPSGSAAMASLHDGMRLLTLPVEADDQGEGARGKALTLKEASDRVFVDNDEARKVLDELQLDTLTPQKARNILQRRVENSENVEW